MPRLRSTVSRIAGFNSQAIVLACACPSGRRRCAAEIMFSTHWWIKALTVRSGSSPQGCRACSRRAHGVMQFFQTRQAGERGAGMKRGRERGEPPAHGQTRFARFPGKPGCARSSLLGFRSRTSGSATLKSPRARACASRQNTASTSSDSDSESSRYRRERCGTTPARRIRYLHRTPAPQVRTSEMSNPPAKRYPQVEAAEGGGASPAQ